MPIIKRYNRPGWRVWLVLAAGLCLLAGCVSHLCNKHLYIYREAPQKQPPAQVALVITELNLAQAVMPGANLNMQGAQWAPDQVSYPTPMYRLSIETVDGQKAYEGMCMDYLPVYAMDLRPGTRRLAVRVDLLSPDGQEKFTDTVPLDLKAGQAYFIRPDWQELLNKRLVVKTEPLPEAYTPALRARVIDWEKIHNTRASLD